MAEPRPEILLAQPGEIPVDVNVRLFLDAKKWGPIDQERTILDTLMDLQRMIKAGEVMRAVIKSYNFPGED